MSHEVVVLCIIHVGVLVLAPWITYWDLLFWGGFVSDDLQGIANYDYAHPLQKLNPQTKQWEKDFSWVSLVTFCRAMVAKVPNPAWRTDKKQPQYVPHPRRLHRLSNYLASFLYVLAYSALCTVVSPTVAFLTVLLWAVHPVGCQIIGWISGSGYLAAATLMFLGVNWIIWSTSHGLLNSPLGVLTAVGVYTVVQALACRCQFTAMGITPLLLWLGYHPVFVIVAALIGLNELRYTYAGAIALRLRTFKEQKMEASTRLHFRKIIVVVKTWGYYLTRLALWPKRMGLYHTYGYHYPLPDIEQEDRYFWLGLLLLIGYGLISVFASHTLQLGLLWYACFIVFVLNWITIHQFVAERYVWLPVLGLCFVAASVAPAWVVWLLIGIALARTWAHHPTYHNERVFYLSNLINFPSSEVATGNLGVAYLREGLVGSAIDAWNIGARINPEYDVNWYNLYSSFRAHGQLGVAREYLVKALSCGTCHFPQQWGEELQRLDAEAAFLAAASKIPEAERLPWMRAQLLRATSDTTVMHQSLWQDILRRVEEEIKKRPPVMVTSAVTVETTPAIVVESVPTATPVNTSSSLMVVEAQAAPTVEVKT